MFSQSFQNKYFSISMHQVFNIRADQTNKTAQNHHEYLNLQAA